MSRADQPIAQKSYGDYLVFEAGSDRKHEYLNGLVYAMAGGTPEHAALAAALLGQLAVALRGKPCRAYSSDLRVRIPDTGLTTYPDASVVCGKLEVAPDDPNAVTNPRVLFEVLSEGSEAYDRGAKAAHYRRIPSLAEYVLVAQHEPRIEVYFRNERGHFELVEARAGEEVAVASLGITLRVDELYADPLG